METTRQEAADRRREDFDRLVQHGIQPYPERFETTHPNIDQIPHELDQRVRVAGRVTAVRIFGKLAFVKLSDVTGQIQAAVSLRHVGEEAYRLFAKTCRVGDFLGVEGVTFHTKTGEFTVQAEEYQILGLALRELPEKWHGLKDVETRYRQRYLDLVANRESRDQMLARCRLISAMRGIFESEGFFEIETPILNITQSGALAKPFTTHHNSLDIDVFLRIAPETYLKRANAAGFNRVFEFAKCFRNEGISADYLQEFTMLEYYGAYWNFEDNIAFTTRLLRESLRQCFGGLRFEIPAPGGEGETLLLDFEQPWPRLDLRTVIRDACGIDVRETAGVDPLLAATKKAGIELDKEDIEARNFGRLVDALYKKVVRPGLIQPCILTGHLLELSPLARKNDDDPQIVDRFQVIALGSELVNAYSELVDPLDQRARLASQAALRKGGDDEAMELDEDYLLCMEHGMPPISGTGIGIDRLLKTVLGLPNIKDAVLFPLLRKA